MGQERVTEMEKERTETVRLREGNLSLLAGAGSQGMDPVSTVSRPPSAAVSVSICGVLFKSALDN